jgi:hypothetical protein
MDAPRHLAEFTSTLANRSAKRPTSLLRSFSAGTFSSAARNTRASVTTRLLSHALRRLERISVEFRRLRIGRPSPRRRECGRDSTAR